MYFSKYFENGVESARTTHCLKITQNVAFEFWQFFTDFCPIKTDLSGNTV